MSNNKKYWKNLAELNSANNDVFDDLQNKEFVQEIPVDEFLSDKDNLANSSTSRRDFLKYIGFSTAAATLAACEGPVVKSIPYVVQPKEIIPGVANYYATTIGNGYDFANILIKKYNLNTNSYQIFERLSNTQEFDLVIKSLKLKLFKTDNSNLQFDIFCNDYTESILNQIKFT